MSSMVLMPTNGSSSHAKSWMQQSVQQFFSGFNWEDHPPEIQNLRATAGQRGDEPLSLILTVSQFFGAVNWEGGAIAALPSHSIEQAASASPTGIDAFTLDDFSDLF